MKQQSFTSASDAVNFIKSLPKYHEIEVIKSAGKIYVEHAGDAGLLS